MPLRRPLRANREPDAKNSIHARRYNYDIPPRRNPLVVDPIQRVELFQTVFGFGGKSEDG